MPTCPKCSASTLRHTLVNNSLAANGCNRCKGVLVSLVTYRDWRERSGLAGRSVDKTECLTEVPDTKDAMVCGKCRNLMTKFRISAETDNRLDYCASCDEVWLDGGEWEMIEKLVGSGELANITTQPWQYRVTTATTEMMALERLKKTLGDDFQSVAQFRELLDGHPARLEILAYLSSNSR